MIRRLPLAYWGLVLTYLAVAVNLSLTSVALPTIGAQLPATTSQLSWIFTVTPLASASIVLLAGGWADRFGRRRVLVIGLALFIASAVLSALASDPAQLIAFRALTGVASALAMPTALALAYDVVDDDLHATAVGVLGSTQAGGALLGPLLAGVVLEGLGWRAVFVAVIPFLLLALLGAIRIPVRTGADGDREPMDSWGAGLASLVSVSLVFAIASETDGGLSLSAPTLVSLVVAIGAAVALVRRERRNQQPMFDPQIMVRRDFRLAIAVVLGTQLVLGGLLFVSTLQFQVVLGYSPLASGLLLLPALVGWVLASAGAGRLARVLGIRLAVVASLALGTAGLLLMAALGDAPLGPVLVLALFLVGMLAAATALMTHTNVSAYAEARRGTGSAINAATGRLGFSLGVALLGALLQIGYTASLAAALGGLSDAQAESARRGISGVQDVAAQLPDDQAQALIEAARVALSAGISWGLAAAGALTALMTVAVLVLGRGHLPERATAHGEA